MISNFMTHAVDLGEKGGWAWASVAYPFFDFKNAQRRTGFFSICKKVITFQQSFMTDDFFGQGECFFSSVKQHSWCIRARNKGLRTGAVNYELTLNYDLWTIPFSVHCGCLNLNGFWEKGALFFLNRWLCFEDWNCVQVWEILTCQSSFWFGLWWGLSSLMPKGCVSLAPGFLNLSSNGTWGMRLGRGQ